MSPRLSTNWTSLKVHPNRRPHLAPSPVLRGCPICPMAAGPMTPARPAADDGPLAHRTVHSTPGSEAWLRSFLTFDSRPWPTSTATSCRESRCSFTPKTQPIDTISIVGNPARVHPRFLPKEVLRLVRKRRKTKHKCSGSPAKAATRITRLFEWGLGHPGHVLLHFSFQRAGTQNPTHQKPK